MITLMSFGFKSGTRPTDATLILDCRRMANPHHDRRLRELTGKDAQVQSFVKGDPLFKFNRDKALAAAREGETVAFGCYGGRHRSVAMAELVASDLRGEGIEVTIKHCAL